MINENLAAKGQLISKANCQAMKKPKNEFVFTTMQQVFVCFLEEIEDSKNAFQNYLTFNKVSIQLDLNSQSISDKNEVTSIKIDWLLIITQICYLLRKQMDKFL